MTAQDPRDTDPLVPTGPAYDDPAYRAGFRAGLDLRPTKLGLLTIGIALGLIAGIIIGRSTLAATPRPSAQSHGTPVAAIPVVGQSELRTGEPPRLGGEPAGAPQSSVGGSPTAGASLAPSPRPTTVIGTPACYPAPCRTPAPTDPPRPATVGIASWYDDGPGMYAAVPSFRWGDEPYRVRVCAARCVYVTVRDFCGCPDGRLIDLSRDAFAEIGEPVRGLVRVTVTRP